MRLTGRRAAHLLLALAGLALLVLGVVRVASPDVSCRGVEMHPGDVCHKNGFGQMGTDEVQSYEQRLHSARISQPVVIGTGALVLAFGGALLVQDLRREDAARA
ncbi:hypothetical protein [Luteococcus peritonei]|uniref:Uncharacterized protein n=1 Tax=Luteococcus peritonei TaxID=88874 RepID=A0ABW4RQJ3_9ACTN